MSNFTKEVTIEEYWKLKYDNAMDDTVSWKHKYMNLFNKYEALQIEYNAAAKQANMHPLLQEPDMKDIDTGYTGGDITEDTKWGDLDPDLEKLDRKKANQRVEF